jgi:hypothetical protein
MQHQPHARYRPRKKQGRAYHVKSFSVSDATIKGLDEIRAAFQRRFPQSAFPSLSCVLEQLISENLARLNRNPAALAVEVEQFEKKWPRGTKPYAGKDYQPKGVRS